MFGGEESFRRHARGFIVLLKRLASRQSVAVILVAHPSITGMNTNSGLSGSTDWHNGPRARLYLAKPDDKDDANTRKRTLTVMKVQRSAMEGTVFHLRSDAGVFVYERREGGPTPYERAASASKAETVFMAILQMFEQQGRRVSPNAGANYAPFVFEKEPDAEGV